MLFNSNVLSIRKKIWDEWDPIGIKFFFKGVKDDDDEYDAYAVEIYGLLKNKCSERELFNYLWRLETQHMCLDGDKEKTKKFAHSLLTDLKALAH